jgi:sugar phosphate isomerase/epimerase
MQPIRIGIQLASLGQSFKTALQTAARLGADAVEIDVRNGIPPGALSQTGLRQLRKMMDDLQLKVSAATFQTRRGYNVADDLQQRVEATKKAMSLAYELGTSVVVNQIGRVPTEAEGPEWNLFFESLADIGNHGQKCGAMLAARTGTESGETLAKLIQALPPGSLTVDFDPGFLIVNGYSATDALQHLSTDIVHVHARDGVQDLAQGRGLEVELGRGSADFQTILASLEQRSYNGYFTVQRPPSSDPIESTSNAVEYLRNLGSF